MTPKPPSPDPVTVPPLDNIQIEPPSDDLVPERWVSKSPAKRAMLLALTCVFAFLGVVGWLVPIVTGLPFYVLALVTAAMSSRRVCRSINALDLRLSPKIRLALRRWRNRLFRNPS